MTTNIRSERRANRLMGTLVILLSAVLVVFVWTTRSAIAVNMTVAGILLAAAGIWLLVTNRPGARS